MKTVNLSTSECGHAALPRVLFDLIHLFAVLFLLKVNKPRLCQESKELLGKMDKLSLALKLLTAVIFTTVDSSKIKEDPQISTKSSCREKCQPLAFHGLVSMKHV